jgi:hypothetical protein
VLEAVARLEQRVQQQQQQVIAPRRSSAAAAEASLQLQEPAALAGLLSALERVERQEKDIRERWFGSSSSACAAEVSKLSMSEASKSSAAGVDACLSDCMLHSGVCAAGCVANSSSQGAPGWR